MSLGSAAPCLWDWNKLPFWHRPLPSRIQNGAMTRTGVLELPSPHSLAPIHSGGLTGRSPMGIPPGVLGWVGQCGDLASLTKLSLPGKPPLESFWRQTKLFSPLFISSRE